MDGVIKLVPVPKLAPPDAAAYQLMVPADAVAPNVTVPVPQILAGVVPVMVGTVLTVNAADAPSPALPLKIGFIIEPIEIL